MCSKTLLLAFTAIKIHRTGEHAKCFSGWIARITTSGGPLSWLPSPLHMFFCKSYKDVQMNELPCNKPMLELKMHFSTAVCCPYIILSCLNWCGMEWVGNKQLGHTVTCEKTWCSRRLDLVCAIITCFFFFFIHMLSKLGKYLSVLLL